MSNVFAFDILTKKTFKFTTDELINFKIEENNSLKEFLGVTEENKEMLYSLYMLGFFDDIETTSAKFLNIHYIMLENWLKGWRTIHIDNKYLWRSSYEMTKNKNLYEYVSEKSTLRAFLYNDSDDTDEILREYFLKMK